ncbi:DNA helicase [candidate division WS5 bacterium]|uniref:DNA helicase n=1 Tax=candidate division WS5 bacterium TaxID=2093353 RepID=A0A419DE30_9BACT|nr:MAG: DNA helicase [candidate division WS5 bacterium]
MSEEFFQETVVDAIDSELRLQRKTLKFIVSSKFREGKLWRIILEESDNNTQLDESLEGALAWWNEPSTGFAEILTVIPEENQVVLRFVSADPPDRDQRIFIKPLCFLEPLKTAWEDEEWFEQIEKEYSRFLKKSPDTIGSGLKSSQYGFDWLREAQKQAFSLFDYAFGFLWGPPGTGKTTTLGVMLASHLLKFPQKKILLISTTNVALDQAVVSVDKALEKLPNTWQTRESMKRIGNHFRSEYYADRRHLLPATNEALLQELIRLEAQKPDPHDTQAYAQWKEQYETIRKLLKQKAIDILRSSTLCAITSTRATFELSLLREFQPFDLLVFDESSQMSQAHALALCPLARQVIFAGDPKQLSPIFQTHHPDVSLWLGNSMFRYKQKGSGYTVMLSEQSRMLKPICDIVSNVFYDGQLVVAKDKENDPEWIKERTIEDMTAEPVTIFPAESDSTWSAKYGGPIRYSSAADICKMVQAMINKNIDKTKIAVLAPFRAQRRLIRAMLRAQGVTKVLVSTVHRVQGSERHIIIFDPVDGLNNFLQDENGEHLINVAISRAMACLVIFLSDNDCLHPIFKQIKNIHDLSKEPSECIPLENIIFDSDFPGKFINKKVKFPGCMGTIDNVLTDDKVIVIDSSSGQSKTFKVSFLREKIKKEQEQRNLNH